MLSPATRITLSTIRLLCGNAGQFTSQGTGFLFALRSPHNDHLSYPVILTNKHVVRGFTQLSTTITTVPTQDAVREDCTADGMIHHPVQTHHLQDLVISHPDPNTDLCAILAMPFMGHLIESQAPALRHMFLDENWLPSADVRSLLRPVEKIVMVGYPNGLWDQTHNLPIVRDGLTGSHPLLNWNGVQQFVVDAACFPGSSGSPVFLLEDGMYRTAGGYTPGTRVALLGILFGGPLLTMEGRLEQRPIPTAANEVPVFNAMMNLGYVVRADAILDLKALLPPPQ
ncbi:S1 family peptidase [Cupriavidus pauculus]